MLMPGIHTESLQTSTALAGYYVANFITPLEVIRTLHAAGIRFTLVGAHGLGGWMQESRATQDVDVIVAARQHKKAVKILTDSFPQLDADSHDLVTRLCDRESKQVLIDVIKPNEAVFREALKQTTQVQTGDESL